MRHKEVSLVEQPAAQLCPILPMESTERRTERGGHREGDQADDHY